jgi:transposase
MKQALHKLLDSYHRKKGVCSMLASLLYHTNQIENVQVNDVEYFSEKIVFHALYLPKDVACSCCGYTQTALKGKKIRKLRMAPLGSKPTWLSVEIHRLECRNCLHIEWPKMPFVKGKKRVTRSFEQYVIGLMSFSAIKHVADFLSCSWDLVKEIHKDYLRREFTAPNLKLVRYIGIDEFSISKGHKYMTIFIDLETGVILHAVEGKSINSVTPFMLRLKEEASQLKAIAMDMNAAYGSAVKESLPNADVVYDRFHIVALLNTAIDEIRRDQPS